MKNNKNEKIDYFDKMIKQLQLTLEEESEHRQRLEGDLNTEITGLEKNCQKIIEEAGKERQVLDTKLINKMNSHVEQIQSEIQRSLATSSEANPDLEYIVQEEIPKLQRESTNEINLRRELEGKILEQFMEQITELQDIFQEEKRDREAKEEEIVGMLKNVSSDVEQL